MARLQRLLDIMARLRDPDGGCPWDLEQDFASISPHTIEEAYEVDEAIASGDAESLRDELGDLLFQVVFQARIAEEKGLFAFDGVVEAIIDKLVRRHPHIFASAEAPASTAAQLADWEEIKAAERAAAGKGEGPPDPFEGIPRRLPALARSAKIAGRVARSSVPPTVEPSTARATVEGALDTLVDPAAEEAGIALGEALRALAVLARAAGLDPEQALREADDREVDRVRAASAGEAHQGSRSATR
ncbi:MAG: nucleoside triphosphate pyrophosphohydrolase [Myxococcota bacterium]